MFILRWRKGRGRHIHAGREVWVLLISYLEPLSLYDTAVSRKPSFLSTPGLHEAKKSESHVVVRGNYPLLEVTGLS